MEARKTLTLMLAALALTACKYDDSELWEQVNRNTEHYTGIKVDFGDTQRLFMTNTIRASRWISATRKDSL